MNENDEQALFALKLEGWEIYHTKFWAGDYVYMSGGPPGIGLPSFKSVTEAYEYAQASGVAPGRVWLK